MLMINAMNNAAHFILLIFVFSVTACGNNSYQEEPAPSVLNYTVLDAAQYYQNMQATRAKVQSLITALQTGSFQNTNDRVAFIYQQLADIPYLSEGAMGEGDWQPESSVYQPGATHIKQDPVYRLDGLDCQTLVQMTMALLYSSNLAEFDQTIIKVAYGAAGNPFGEVIHYYNRNNFVDADWNPINQQNGFLTDVTSQGNLAPYSETTSVDITRQNWFLFQQKNLATNVRVLNDAYGLPMANRFMQTYSELNFPRFGLEHVSIAYIPKEKLALQQSTGSYQPDQALLDSILTPAVVEIVRDAKKWTIGGKNIKNVIGSELSISHMGLLYWQRFNYGEVIYQKTTCNYDEQRQKVCSVTPIICETAQCNELMFVHATDARPNGYYWYQQADGGYTCSSKLPTDGVGYTKCNRVEREPLFNYLTEYQYGSYRFMDNPSIVGIHIEKLS